MKANVDRMIDLVAVELVGREPSRSVDLATIHERASDRDEVATHLRWGITACIGLACAAVAALMVWNPFQDLNLALPSVAAVELRVPSPPRGVPPPDGETRSTDPDSAGVSQVTADQLPFEPIEIDPLQVRAVELAPLAIDPAEIEPIVVEPLTASND
jgi:hypothetical protein